MILLSQEEDLIDDSTDETQKKNCDQKIEETEVNTENQSKIVGD